MKTPSTQALATVVTQTASSGARVLANLPIPSPLRKPIWGRLARALGADVSESADSLESFNTWQAMFTRKLHAQARTIHTAADVLASPVDGAVHSIVEIRSGQLFQVKGRQYSLETFVGDPNLAAQYEGGTAITIYLRPKDYHWVHAPADIRITQSVHYDGSLWPVNPWANRNVASLYCKNERKGFMIASETMGNAMLWMVGALFVGGIETTFACGDDKGRLQALPNEARLARGDALGAFLFGSTVIMLLPPDRKFSSSLQPNDEVRYGQPLGKIVAR